MFSEDIPLWKARPGELLGAHRPGQDVSLEDGDDTPQLGCGPLVT